MNNTLSHVSLVDGVCKGHSTGYFVRFFFCIYYNNYVYANFTMFYFGEKGNKKW